MKRAVLAACAAALVHAAFAQDAAFAPAPAGPLLAAYRQARDFDPQFRAAIAEKSGNEAAATASRFAYLPDLRMSQSQLETENSAVRRTFQISQPLINADRFLTFRQSEPQALIAESTFAQREQELALRLLKAVTELVRAREATRANENKIGLLAEQARAAQRLFERGQGTITDVRDTEVRVEQARAAQLALLTRVRVAENQYAAITGAQPAKDAFAIADAPRAFPLDPLSAYLDGSVASYPQLVTLRQQERLAEIGALRAKAALLPTVSGTYTQTQIGDRNSNFTGIAISMPLQAPTLAQIANANAQLDRAREATRQQEQTLKVDVERLRDLVASGQQELVILKQAINAADLAVIANRKSYQGGERTQVDVLNSIQTQVDAYNAYVNSAATLAENQLSLLLESAYRTPEALAQVQAAFLR